MSLRRGGFSSLVPAGLLCSLVLALGLALLLFSSQGKAPPPTGPDLVFSSDVDVSVQYVFDATRGAARVGEGAHAFDTVLTRDGRSMVRVEARAAAMHAPGWGSSDTSVVWRRLDGSGSQEIFSTRADTLITTLALTPDEKHLSFVHFVPRNHDFSPEGLWEINTIRLSDATMVCRPLRPLNGQPVACPDGLTYTAAGDWIVACVSIADVTASRQRPATVLFHAETGEQRLLFPDRHACVSPRGDRIAYGEPGGQRGWRLMVAPFDAARLSMTAAGGIEGARCVVEYGSRADGIVTFRWGRAGDRVYFLDAADASRGLHCVEVDTGATTVVAPHAALFPCARGYVEALSSLSPTQARRLRGALASPVSDPRQETRER